MKKYKIVFVLLTAIYSLLPAILSAQWTQATVNTAWPARYSHTLIANDNKTWEMGGWNGSSLRNDVWNSIGLTEPAIPTLVSPPNNSVTNNQTPTFIWNLVPGAVAYDLRLDQRIGDVPMPWTTWEIEPGVSAHATIRYSPDYTDPVTITPWYTTLPYVIPLDSLNWDATEILPWVSRDPIVLFPGDTTRLGMWLTANDSSALIRYTVTHVSDTLTKIITQYDPLSRDSVWASWAAHNNTFKRATNFELEIECDSLNMHNISTKLPTYGASDAWGCPPKIWIIIIHAGPGGQPPEQRKIHIKWEDKSNPVEHCNSKNFGIKIPSNIKIQKAMGRWTKDPPSKGLFKTLQIADTTWTPSEPIEIGTYDWTVRAQDDLGNWSEFAAPWTFTTVTLQTFTISGYVSTSAGTGISEVVMNGLPGNPNTDANGYYTDTVDYGWSGTVTPTKTGYSFSPPSTSYSNVTANQSTNYTGTLQTITLPPPTISHLEPESGEQGETLELSCFGSNFVEGATVSFNPPTGITIDSVIFVDSLKLKAKNRIAADAPLGPRDVIVTNPDGQYATLTDGFTVVSVTGVVEHSDVPTDFALLQSYPNPFNPSTTIEYHLPISGFVKLSVFDLLGREIAILVNEKKSVGKYRVTFYASNLPAGVYFYRMKAGQFQETRKLVLLK